MANLIFENLSMKQAETLARWFESQGEQDCVDYFEMRRVKPPKADVQQGDWLTVAKLSETVRVKMCTED